MSQLQIEVRFEGDTEPPFIWETAHRLPVKGDILTLVSGGSQCDLKVEFVRRLAWKNPAGNGWLEGSRPQVVVSQVAHAVAAVPGPKSTE